MESDRRSRKVATAIAASEPAPESRSIDVKRKIVGKLLALGGTVEEPGSRSSELELPIKRRDKK